MKAIEANHFVLSIGLKKDKIESYEQYPFCLPIVKNLKEIQFHDAVTYFVGENGSGKSTLLEALAVSLGFNPEGGTINFNFNFNTHIPFGFASVPEIFRVVVASTVNS